MSKRLPADRLPKGTTRELRVLRIRCLDLVRAKVYISPLQVKALDRVIAYLAATAPEGQP